MYEFSFTVLKNRIRNVVNDPYRVTKQSESGRQTGGKRTWTRRFYFLIQHKPGHIWWNKTMVLFPAAGLPDRSRLQAPNCAGKAKAQERRGDPCHGHGVHVCRGHGQRCCTAALQVAAAATAEGEDTLAQLAQQLHQSQRRRRRGALQQPDHHGECTLVGKKHIQTHLCVYMWVWYNKHKHAGMTSLP